MEVRKVFTMECSHILPNHPGRCKRLHGHSYSVEVTVIGDPDPATGFVIDFHDLKDVVQPIIDQFDHQHLNFFIKQPSAENIAIHIAHLLRHRWPSNVQHYAVAVEETKSTCAIWLSMNPKDVEIFSQDSLDSKPGAMDAGWRSPNPGQINDVAGTIAWLEGSYPGLLAEALRKGMVLAQCKLYRETLGTPGVIYEKLKEVLKDEQK